jgi:hypothetical protein
VRIRISLGVGSNVKLWAVADRRTQIGEFDVSDVPGWRTETAIGGMTGIVWKRGRIAETYPRKCYASPEEWVADLRAEYPDAAIDRADGEPQNWL